MYLLYNEKVLFVNKMSGTVYLIKGYNTSNSLSCLSMTNKTGYYLPRICKVILQVLCSIKRI